MNWYYVLMFSFLLTVVGTSLSGVMMPGPLFAVTVAKSYKSRLAGLQMSAGHAVVEVPIQLAIYLGLGVTQFFERTSVQLGLYLAGALMLIWMGVSALHLRNQALEGKDLPYSSVAAGAAMSGGNPGFLLWWATVGATLVTQALPFGWTGFIAFAVVHWLCDAVWLSFVSVLVHRTHSLWGKGFQQGLFIVSSLLLFGFGGWFLFSAVRLVA